MMEHEGGGTELVSQVADVLRHRGRLSQGSDMLRRLIYSPLSPPGYSHLQTCKEVHALSLRKEE